MPTYEYACKSCGEHLEVVQSFKDDALTVCPACQGQLRKVFGNIGIAFKGSGFYRTDSRSDGRAAAKTSADKASGDKGAGDKGSGASAAASSSSGSAGAPGSGAGSSGTSGTSSTSSAAGSSGAGAKSSEAKAS